MNKEFVFDYRYSFSRIVTDLSISFYFFSYSAILDRHKVAAVVKRKLATLS